MKDIIKGLIFVGLFAVPFLTLYVENNYFFPFITGKNFWFRIIVEIVAALYIILALLDKAYRPRFSWLLASFSALIVVMFAATMNAEHIPTALWSNFERMDGYITLIHVFLFFVVLGNMLKTPRLWSIYLHTSVVVAALVALRGLAQLSGEAVRVDSTLGNAAYMAIYMLFHIFILAFLMVQTKVTPYRVIYGLVMVLFAYVLLQTGTRGTAIGLATGSLAAVAYMVLFTARHPQVRKYALGGVALLVLMFGSFYVARDSEYVQSSPALARIANIDLGNDLTVRGTIWGMSVEGVKERPLLGWGNGNFNYVFNEQYNPALYAQEQWFDRVHNIFFDWLIAGGVLGFVAYFSIFAAAFYYLVWCAWKGDNRFTVVERGILFGLLVGYLTHNLVVFDNIISYIFFASILGMLYSRYSDEWTSLTKINIPAPIVNQIVAPIVVVLMAATVYVVNVPGMQAAGQIIVAFQTQDVAARLEVFKETLALNSFGRQEIVEQLAQQAMGLAQPGAQVDPAVLEEFLTFTESELQKMVADKPGDARLHVFLSSYYRAIGNVEKARAELELARKYSPKKQAIILQQGAVEIGAGNNAAALAYFKEAYELDTRNEEAKEFYLATLFYMNDVATAEAMLTDATPEFKARLAASDFMLNAVNNARAFDLLAELYEIRVQTAAPDAQNWASLAFVYYQMAQNASSSPEQKKLLTDKAIETLSRGAAAVPSFATMAQCVTTNLKAGRAPEVGCQ